MSVGLALAVLRHVVAVAEHITGREDRPTISMIATDEYDQGPCARAARDEGYRALTLMATLPGVPLFLVFGFTEIRRVDIPMPDGVILAGVEMQRSVSR